jgi:hypothetical protein
MMGGIYEVRRWDRLRCHDIHTEFLTDWFRHSNVDTEEYTHRQQGDLISVVLFFENKEGMLKIFAPAGNQTPFIQPAAHRYTD